MHKLTSVFIEAWYHVLASFSSKKILSANVLALQGRSAPSDIAIRMGLMGDLVGEVLLSVDEQTGAILASEMLGGMDTAGEDELVRSAVGELCNMIMGTACTGLSRSGEVVDITPPSLIPYEEALTLRQSSPLMALSLSLEDMGCVDFGVSLKGS